MICNEVVLYSKIDGIFVRQDTQTIDSFPRYIVNNSNHASFEQIRQVLIYKRITPKNSGISFSFYDISSTFL